MHISLTVTILNIIHRPVFYLKHSVSDIGFCIRLQVDPNQLVPTDRSSLCHRRLAQLSRFNLETYRIQSPRHLLLNKRQSDG
jgi:hypothetical protein